MRLPAIAQHLGTGPPVVRGQLDAEQVAHLAIEVGEAGLGPGGDCRPFNTIRCPLPGGGWRPSG